MKWLSILSPFYRDKGIRITAAKEFAQDHKLESGRYLQRDWVLPAERDQKIHGEAVFDLGHFFLSSVEYFSVNRGINRCDYHWALGSGKNI